MHVERYGHGGRPVVLIHGFGTSAFIWRAVAPELARGMHTAFALDLLGYGESDRPLDTDFGIAAQAGYLERALTALRLTRASLVGVDIGALVALRLAAIRPERVDRLVLVTPSDPKVLPGTELTAMQRSTARLVIRLNRGVLGVSAFLGPLLQKSVADPAHMPPRLIGRYLAPYVGRDGVNHLLALVRSLRPRDLEPLSLESVAAPTLIAWGEQEPWIDPTLPDRLVGGLPDGRLIRLPHSGRLVPEDEPDRLAELIADHLTGAL
ncbi:MAG: alpha/beta fold hydrolase [Gemmatimonadaceae bacterium]